MQVLDRADAQAIAELIARDEFFWLDLVDPSDDQLAQLGERFSWHPRAVEDMQHLGQRPKLDRYGDQMLIVFYGARTTDALGDEEPQLVEVHMMVSGSWVVTVRRRHCDELDELHRRIAADPSRDEELVVYKICDALTDTFFPVLEQIDDA